MQRRLGVLLLSAAIVFAPFGTTASVNANSLAAQEQGTPATQIRVWVNTASGVYHCPGTRWYGNIKKGRYMTQAEAKKAGHRAAYGKECT